MRLKITTFCAFLMLLMGCKEITTPQQVLPTFIHQGEEVTVYANPDNLSINTDSLFFKIQVFTTQREDIYGHIKLEDGKGRFVVPKNAAAITGYFYNLNEGKDEKEYVRLVYNKETNKPVENAYVKLKTEEGVNKELALHPENLSVYAHHVGYYYYEWYFGRESDTLVRQTAQKYLPIVEEKANRNRAGDLFALASLYLKVGEVKKAERIILEMLKKHPNSAYFKQIYLEYSVASKNLMSYYPETKQEKELTPQATFLDSLSDYIAQNHPHSPAAVQESCLQTPNHTAPFKNYTPEQVATNIYHRFYSKDTTHINLLGNLFAVKMHLKEYDSAESVVKKYIQMAQNKLDKHYLILSNAKASAFLSGGTEDKNFHISYGYFLLHQVHEKRKEFEKVISYLDSINLKNKTNKQHPDYKGMTEWNRFKKASLQRQLQQPAAALETYQKLYAEFPEEAILDSIRVLFKEQDQADYAASFIANLKKNKQKTSEKRISAPDFTIKNMEGEEISLQDLRGKTVFINFWGVYCLPCVREMPFINELWKNTQNENVVFLAPTREDALAVQRFNRRQKEHLKCEVLPSAQTLFDAFDIPLIPTQIIINPKGEIVHKQVGATQEAEAKLLEVLERELGQEIFSHTNNHN